MDAAVLAGDVARRELLDEKSEGAPLTEAEESAASEAIALKMKEFQSEGLLSRIWVLVDGGYFDNTGLTPTKEALSVISEERRREGKRKSEQPRPYTRTRVQVIHLSNDPGTMRFELPAGWLEKLSQRTRRYLQVSKRQLQCAHELLALEESLLANPFYSLIAPMQSILAVREEHSRQEVARLKAENSVAAPRRAWVVQELSMREALS